GACADGGGRPPRGRALSRGSAAPARPAYLPALAEAASDGDIRSVEFRLRRDAAGAAAGAEFVWVEMRCRALDQAPADGVDREVVAVMRDMTRRNEQEQALERARSEAEHANAAKSRFLAT